MVHHENSGTRYKICEYTPYKPKYLLENVIHVYNMQCRVSQSAVCRPRVVRRHLCAAAVHFCHIASLSIIKKIYFLN
jgi:hypothetical protein